MLGSAALVLGPAPADLYELSIGVSRWVASGLLGQADVATRERVEIGANVLLFIPMGALLRLATVRASSLALLGACAVSALFVEVAQALVLPSRHPSARDSALNTLGAGVGILAVHLAARMRRPRAGPFAGS